MFCAKSTWFSNANAYVNISSRFSTTQFLAGGPVPPRPPLKSPMGTTIATYIAMAVVIYIAIAKICSHSVVL